MGEVSIIGLDLAQKTEMASDLQKPRSAGELFLRRGGGEVAITAFIDHCNNHRYHESIGNLTPADACFDRGETIQAERRRIKRLTIQNRRLNHQRQAA